MVFPPRNALNLRRTDHAIHHNDLHASFQSRERSRAPLRAENRRCNRRPEGPKEEIFGADHFALADASRSNRQRLPSHAPKSEMQQKTRSPDAELAWSLRARQGVRARIDSVSQCAKVMRCTAPKSDRRRSFFFSDPETPPPFCEILIRCRSESELMRCTAPKISDASRAREK
jgi:hypothetical protein